MVPKQQRVSRKEFPLFFKKGRFFSFTHASFRISSNPGQIKPKFGVVLPGKWQKQKPLRNKTKRRALLILGNVIKRDFPSEAVVICFLKKEAASLSFADLKQNLEKTLKETNQRS